MSAANLTGAPTRVAAVQTSYVEWGPIFAGAVLAAALSLVLFAFAGGVGLAISSPWPGEAPGAVLGVVSIAWTMIVLLFSSMAGAYVAGRLRSPRADATADEIEVRDGTHGLLVWATGLLLGALAAMALSLAAQSAAADADDAAPTAVSYEADKLIRGVGDERAELRAEIDPILARAALTGSFPDADRAYLAALIADAGDVSEVEARSRIDSWATAAAEEADAARKAAAIAAFLLAATTLTAGAAAYFAGGMGGRHRDRNSPFLWTRARAV